jgi:protein N-terminal methyltransferase
MLNGCKTMVGSNGNGGEKPSISGSVAEALKKSQEVVHGSDSEGRKYATIAEMWSSEGVSSGNTSSWYARASEYYEENCPASLDGVLGGFGSISNLDLKGSKRFLEAVQKERPALDWSAGAGCECGAGIGRVTKGLLLPLGVQRCDLVESSARLLSEAPKHIGEPGANLCRFYCTGLQEWTPRKQSYTIIWIQWVLCYLTDEDCVEFLKRCGEGLIPKNGVIVLKENTCDGEAFVLDNEDASVTRSVPYLLKLAQEAGLEVVTQQTQDTFPKEIYPVPMIALDLKRK